MINENELRVGNWVKHNDFISTSQFPNDIFQWSISHWYDIATTHLNLVSIDPIPLTPEILKSNGFKKSNYKIFYIKLNRENYIWIKKVNGVWKLYIGEGISNLIQIASCKYLHQLQNRYYALTKKELKIKF